MNENSVNLDGLSFFTKEKVLKEFNYFWKLLDLGIDINKIISPDLFHTLFSCITNTLHFIIFESLNKKQKEDSINNCNKIIYLQKMKKINLNNA